MTEQLPPPEAPDDGASLGQAARQLRMSTTTVRRWAKNGWLPSTVTSDGERKFDRSLTAVVPSPGESDGSEA